MSSIEQSPEQNNGLPSGYVKAEQLPNPVEIDENVLPWLEGPYALYVAACELIDGTQFLTGSVVGSSNKLIHAAEGMTDKQRTITDNMFYSRIAGYMQNGGQSSGVESVPKAKTDFAVHVMRNNGGQRVYFGVANLKLNKDDADTRPVVLRLAVCDKNRQGDIFKVLTKTKERERMQKMRGSK